MALLQDAATTGNGTVFNCGGISDQHTLYVQWAADVTAGVVTFETARLKGYTGTWASLLTANYNAGATDVYTFDAPLHYVRARISTEVSGGDAPSVTVELVRHIHPTG